MVSGHLMRYALRPMRDEDIPQVLAIDRDAFPTTWPPPAFRQELRNRLARYLVVWDTQRMHRDWAQEEGVTDASATEDSAMARLGSALRRLLGNDRPRAAETQELLTAYVGLWLVVDEAHITSVGVRSAFRGQGIGELLIIGALEIGILEGCRQATLECRVSNVVAQNLYKKYGFKIMGRRKAYYVDNSEDAFVMTAEHIDTPVYQAQLDALRAHHSERWGVSTRYLA